MNPGVFSKNKKSKCDICKLTTGYWAYSADNRIKSFPGQRTGENEKRNPWRGSRQRPAATERRTCLLLCTHQGFPDGQMIKNPPAMQEPSVWFLGWEDPLEKGMATHSSILAWRIPWIEEPGGLQSMGSQRVRHDWVTNTHTQASAHSSDCETCLPQTGWKFAPTHVHVCSIATLWTVAHQAPLSMGFSRQEYWNGLHAVL